MRFMTTTAANAAIAPENTQRARASGVARTISRRPPVSSDAHFDTNVAAAKPGGDVEQLDVELEEATGRGRIEPREGSPEDLQEVLVPGDLGGHRAHDRGQHGAHEAEADAPRQRPRELVAERAAGRAADPEHTRRELRQPDAGGDPEVTAREQGDTGREQHGCDDPDQGQGGPVVLADERDVVGRPVERAEQVQGIEIEAVDGPGQRQGDTGDPGRSGAAEERAPARTPGRRRTAR